MTGWIVAAGAALVAGALALRARTTGREPQMEDILEAIAAKIDAEDAKRSG